MCQEKVVWDKKKAYWDKSNKYLLMFVTQKSCRIYQSGKKVISVCKFLLSGKKLDSRVCLCQNRILDEPNLIQTERGQSPFSTVLQIENFFSAVRLSQQDTEMFTCKHLSKFKLPNFSWHFHVVQTVKQCVQLNEIHTSKEL